MIRQSRMAIWPFVLVTAILFVFTVLAPRSWQWEERTSSDPRRVPSDRPPSTGSGSVSSRQRTTHTRATTSRQKASQRSGRVAASARSRGAGESRSAGRQSPERTESASRKRDKAQSVTDGRPSDSAKLAASAMNNVSTRSRGTENGAAEPPGVPALEQTAGDGELDGQRTSAGERLLAASPMADRMGLDATDSDGTDHLRPNLDLETESVRAPLASVEEVRGAILRTNAARPHSAGAALHSALPRPDALLAQLARLGEDAIARPWSEAVVEELATVCETGGMDASELEDSLRELRSLVREGTELSNSLAGRRACGDLQRAVYSLSRRLDVWESIQAVQGVTFPVSTQAPGEPLTPAKALEEVESRLAGPDDPWSRFLLLDKLGPLVRSGNEIDADARRQIARRILLRVEAPALTTEQRAFLAREPFSSLLRALTDWVREPVDYHALLESIEQFEQTASGDAAARIVTASQILRWSDEPRLRQVGGFLGDHYRNANARMAISGELMNRFLPPTTTVNEPVRQTVLGARVFGRTRAWANLRIVLFPDRERWRLGLDARGQVNSQTQAEQGPAIFSHRGRANYVAQKLLFIDRRGMHLREAEAAAEGNTEITAIETDYDGVPLINALVRTIARQKHDEKSAVAQRMFETSVARQASARLDQEVGQRLEQVKEQFRIQVLAPLERLDLNPVAIGLETTSERLIVRYRLASSEQLAANTPRPQAPSNSLFSLQLHESAINNALQQLPLAGKTSNIRTLYRDIAAAFDRKDVRVPEDLPDDVTVRFAETNPARVRFDGDRAELTLRISELTADQRVHRDFEVHTWWEPKGHGLDARLVRDPLVSIGGLDGRPMGMRERFPLRAIFVRVFAENRSVPIVPKQLASDKRLADLRLTQAILRDGWLAIALTGDGRPEKVAKRK